VKIFTAFFIFPEAVLKKFLKLISCGLVLFISSDCFLFLFTPQQKNLNFFEIWSCHGVVIVL